jgi:hypothetical protein
VFDRSAPLPTGGYLEQADGTGWVALFCQNMAEIAFELAAHDRTYERLASNYMIQFLLLRLDKLSYDAHMIAEGFPQRGMFDVKAPGSVGVRSAAH